MTREQLKKQTIIILNREDITIEEMTENILQLVDIAINKELRLYGVVKSFYCVDNSKSNGNVKKCNSQCTGCWQIDKINKQ